MSSPLKTVQKFYPKVNKVVDAERSLAVRVEWSDVEGAVRLDPQHCAVARAVEREQHLSGAIISKSIAYLVHGRTAVRYLIPAKMAKQIKAFDRMRDFQPQEYMLEAASATQRLGFQGRPRWKEKPHQRKQVPARRVNGNSRADLRALKG